MKFFVGVWVPLVAGAFIISSVQSQSLPVRTRLSDRGYESSSTRRIRSERIFGAHQGHRKAYVTSDTVGKRPNRNKADVEEEPAEEEESTAQGGQHPHNGKHHKAAATHNNNHNGKHHNAAAAHDRGDEPAAAEVEDIAAQQQHNRKHHRTSGHNNNKHPGNHHKNAAQNKDEDPEDSPALFAEGQSSLRGVDIEEASIPTDTAQEDKDTKPATEKAAFPLLHKMEEARHSKGKSEPAAEGDDVEASSVAQEGKNPKKVAFPLAEQMEESRHKNAGSKPAETAQDEDASTVASQDTTTKPEKVAFPIVEEMEQARAHKANAAQDEEESAASTVAQDSDKKEPEKVAFPIVEEMEQARAHKANAAQDEEGSTASAVAQDTDKKKPEKVAFPIVEEMEQARQHKASAAQDDTDASTVAQDTDKKKPEKVAFPLVEEMEEARQHKANSKPTETADASQGAAPENEKESPSEILNELPDPEEVIETTPGSMSSHKLPSGAQGKVKDIPGLQAALGAPNAPSEHEEAASFVTTESAPKHHQKHANKNGGHHAAGHGHKKDAHMEAASEGHPRQHAAKNGGHHASGHKNVPYVDASEGHPRQHAAKAGHQAAGHGGHKKAHSFETNESVPTEHAGKKGHHASGHGHKKAPSYETSGGPPEDHAGKKGHHASGQGHKKTPSTETSDKTTEVQDTAHGGKPRVNSIYHGTLRPMDENFDIPEPYCGDGYLDPGEDCDFGIDNGYGFCTLDCVYLTIPICGNGIVEDYEECDDGSWNGYGSCTLDCYFCEHEFYADENRDADLAEFFANQTMTCDNGELLVLMWLDTDSWGPTENAIFMFDSASDLDTSIWEYDVGAFQAHTTYEWATCVPADACYEFYYIDTFGDGFSEGGLYFEADGETLLDVYPGDAGTHAMYDEFWGVYFGTCEGSIFEFSERVQPYQYSDVAPFEMDDTSSCSATSVSVLLEYEADVFAFTDNELFLFDADTSVEDFVWNYEIGSFQTGNYTWSTCVEPSRCSEFYYFDDYGDGFASGGLFLTVDDTLALSILPGDNGTWFEGEQYWGVAFGECDGDDAVPEP